MEDHSDEDWNKFELHKRINANLVEIRIPQKFSVCIFILYIQTENFFGILISMRLDQRRYAHLVMMYKIFDDKVPVSKSDRAEPYSTTVKL